ncbi:MAG: AAA family ATPase, partial [Solirubrobacterales bacterium]|nr:AAA family ATPase [Solirubrobacterales bacterium]
RELTVAHPDIGLVLVVAEDSPELLRSGMQAGARDVIAAPVGLEQLEMSVLAAASWTHALRRRAERDAGGELIGLGRIVTVVGAKGGVGTTTAAVHLALAARELGEPGVCLVDYDLQAGDVRAFLDMPYRRSAADLVPVANEMTTRHLTEALYAHSSGVRVLLGPQEGEHAETVTAAAARNILTAIRTREDLTIVDAGSTLSEASAIAVEMADTVLIVSTPDVVSLRGVVRVCSLWDRLKIEPPEVAVLLNRTSRKLEVQPDLARRVVPVPVLQTTVPADFFALESAVNTGIPAAHAASDAMLQPMAAVLGEISALGARGEPESRGERARSIVARFAGESGQATIEFAGLLPLALLVLILLWQIVLVGATFVFSGHAARAGARALAVGDPVQSAALNDLPGWWQPNATVDQLSGQTCSGSASASLSTIDGCVKVKVDTPLLVPGLLDHVLPAIESDSGTVLEEAALPSEQQWVLGTAANAACSASTTPPASATTTAAAGIGSAAAGGSLTGVSPGPYVSPFLHATSVQPQRIDQGVDYDGTGPINAIGDATITLITPARPGWPGNFFIEYQLTGPGPDQGKFVYVAEDITPWQNPPLHAGEHVQAGQPIATFGPNLGDGIETGWGLPNAEAAYADSQYHEGERTAAGQDFSNLMQSVGAPAGCAEGRPIVGHYP